MIFKVSGFSLKAPTCREEIGRVFIAELGESLPGRVLGKDKAGKVFGHSRVAKESQSSRRRSSASTAGPPSFGLEKRKEKKLGHRAGGARRLYSRAR